MPGDSYNPFDTSAPPRIEVFGHQAYAERKLPDEILARFETSDLPEDAVVTHVTMVPYRGERPVLPWREGRFWLPAGEAKQGESALDAVRRVALEQAGIKDLKATHLGHLRCRATVHSRLQPAGTETFRVFYAVDVTELADNTTDPAYERRIVLQRDLNVLLRTQYAELRREYMETLDYFLLERLKQNAKASAEA
jgi:ADP-ribose pyrophosphatase YjhB (NUDIX family)